MKPLVLIGGGGHCKSVIEASESAGFQILGILDMPENVGKEVLSTSIIGTDDDIPIYVDEAAFVITVGFVKDPSIRTKLYNTIKTLGGQLTTVIASTAYVSKYARIDEGSVVLHQAFVNAGAVVGKNTIINTAANIEHDVVIGDHCHISTGAMINGGCKIGERCFIGSQSVLANGITLNDDIIVGAGAFVRESISEKGVYYGNPAIMKINTK